MNMGSVSSEEDLESCSLSADISESESSTGFSTRHFDLQQEAASTNSLTTSDVVDGSSLTTQVPAVTLPVFGGRHVVIPENTPKLLEPDMSSEVDMMKERFAKLLLGEDMSGGAKGVCTALAISNAITNLSDSVFGELWKLEALSARKKLIWDRELEWLLCVSHAIVELKPSLQEFPGTGGAAFEVLVAQPRSDIYVNLPALKKLDKMLLSILDGFHESEFYYVDRGVVIADTNEMEKLWLPFPKVPTAGLSEDTRKRLQQCKEYTNQIFKAAMAINKNVLAAMEIPTSYLNRLPKSGKDCLGEVMYRYLTANHFSPECLLDYLDLTSEYTTLEIANRIETCEHIWKQKYMKLKRQYSSWGGIGIKFVGDIEKTKVLAQRAETLLHNLTLRFPGLLQTSLDIAKIQYNKDVGQSILESYSRVIQSLAFNITARIDDLLYVADATKQRAAAAESYLFMTGGRCKYSSSGEIGKSPDREICYSLINNGNQRDSVVSSLKTLAFS